MSWTAERARVASLTRSRKPDDPELLAARRNLAAARLAARIEEYVAGVVAAAPDLTPAQRDKLAMLLKGGVNDAA
jgi:hypothetical protein